MSERAIWWHWQNLNRDKHNKIVGRGWVHGRIFIHVKRFTLRFNWHFGLKQKLFMGMFDMSRDESGLYWTFAIRHLFFLSFAIEGLPFLKYKNIETAHRSIGWRIFDYGLWIDLWHCSDGWGPQRMIVIHPLDILFGQSKHSKRSLSTEQVIIHMPEQDYLADLELYESTWKRRRWPLSKRMMRWNIKLVSPIPVPGKGENSWDCGEDAIYEISGGAYISHEAAIQSVIKSAMRSRDKYGGAGWLPENPPGAGRRT